MALAAVVLMVSLGALAVLAVMRLGRNGRDTRGKCDSYCSCDASHLWLNLQVGIPVPYPGIEIEPAGVDV